MLRGKGPEEVKSHLHSVLVCFLAFLDGTMTNPRVFYSFWSHQGPKIASNCSLPAGLQGLTQATQPTVASSSQDPYSELQSTDH